MIQLPDIVVVNTPWNTPLPRYVQAGDVVDVVSLSCADMARLAHVLSVAVMTFEYLSFRVKVKIISVLTTPVDEPAPPIVEFELSSRPLSAANVT